MRSGIKVPYRGELLPHGKVKRIDAAYSVVSGDIPLFVRQPRCRVLAGLCRVPGGQRLDAMVQ